MQRVTVRTSTIFISKGGKTRVYRSVDEVPAPLRKELEESTNGFNSATILIADRRGRAEIVRALNGLPSTLRSRLASSLSPVKKSAAVASPAPPAEDPRGIVPFVLQNWMEIGLPIAIGLIVWAAFNYR